MNAFANLGLSQEIVSALTDQGYQEPTPIQHAAIPKALAGMDLLAAAQTGTGKTAAFMLPSLERLKCYANSSTSPAMHPVRMLVLTPTRELADQIDQNVQGYLKNLSLRQTVLFGGMNMELQKQDLRQGCEIVIATVGRLLDHVQQKNIQLNKVEIVVLDEADRMLDMGFIDDIRKIMQMLPPQRQTLLFSATFAPAIQRLAQDFMRNPEEIQVTAQNTTSANVEQHIIALDSGRKRSLLQRLISDLNMNQVIVFCNTKQSVDQVNRELNRRGISAQAIHGDKSQQTRLETLAQFKEGSLRVLVATDVAARGLDIAELPFVINYELPLNAEDYVHRIGRTGRAGAEGVAISLMDEQEQKVFNAIKDLTGNELLIERIEGFEPHWWEQTPAENKASQASSVKVERDAPRQRERVAKPNLNNTNKVQDNKEVVVPCQQIPGRARRFSRHNHPQCALLQPNYGARKTKIRI
ncbi:RNA helicase [Snodgrassella alvi]|uniref:DEAD-box ATP-dependent RNA helicase RhpA n=1 Tax=Snodgrassella alvi TaxID=1196083 RepID=A0A2N9WVV2_9NEIS|nr:DEAD/DEAH box helicase [Snodgrassella alvi]PIT17552.1 RNA helicase [Snodgrassella alvi]